MFKNLFALLWLSLYLSHKYQSYTWGWYHIVQIIYMDRKETQNHLKLRDSVCMLDWSNISNFWRCRLPYIFIYLLWCNELLHPILFIPPSRCHEWCTINYTLQFKIYYSNSWRKFLSFIMLIYHPKNDYFTEEVNLQLWLKDADQQPIKGA